MARPSTKRRAPAHSNDNARPSKQRKLFAKATESQPVVVEDTQPSSPRQALAIASQANDFESQLRDSRPEVEIAAPVETSEAATVASTAPNEEEDDGSDTRFADNFDGIDWSRLKGYIQPPRTYTQRKSWVYDYSYRVALLSNPERVFFVCRECHKNKKLNATGYGLLEATSATSPAANHLMKKHRITPTGKLPVKLPAGQKSLTMLIGAGVRVSKAVANEIGNFNVQAFQLAAVNWLADNNIALRQFKDPAFQSIIRFANPEAEKALWMSHNSVN
jgi:hypothetical protein